VNINTIRKQIFSTFKDKDARDFFVSENIGAVIAAQICSIRESRKWNQIDLAQKCNMAQTRISALENPEYQNYSLKTLKRLASAFDVGLLVCFVSFGELAKWNASMTPGSMAVPDYDHDPYHEALTEGEAEVQHDSVQYEIPSVSKMPNPLLPKEQVGVASALARPKTQEQPFHFRPRSEAQGGLRDALPIQRAETS